MATVIYTKSLQPTEAVVWSGIMNFSGVLVVGTAVAYALVELLPAQVLSAPDGGPAAAMLIARPRLRVVLEDAPETYSTVTLRSASSTASG